MKKHFYHNSIVDICTNKHLPVDEIFAILSKQYPKAGKSTVYRNVEELVELGKLKKLENIEGKSYYEATKDPHAHLICEKTGTIMDIPLFKLPAECLPHGFQVKDIDVRIYGSFA